MSDTIIRTLRHQDGAMYQVLRLESLKLYPAAFLSSFESESKLATDVFSRYLETHYHPPLLGYYGILTQENGREKLVGYAQLNQTFLEKQRHMLFLYNFYISAEYQGLGFGSELWNFLENEVRKHSHIEQMYVSSTAKNTAALYFYQKLGFKEFARRQNAFKWHYEYDDEVEMVKVL